MGATIENLKQQLFMYASPLDIPSVFLHRNISVGSEKIHKQLSENIPTGQCPVTCPVSGYGRYGRRVLGIEKMETARSLDRSSIRVFRNRASIGGE